MSLFTTTPKLVAPPDNEEEYFARGSLRAELSPWINEKPGVSFGVTVVALTRAAVDIEDNGRLKLGQHYLLEIARPGTEPITTLCQITRAGRWKARAEFDMPLTDPDHKDLESRLLGRRQQKPRITSPRTRSLFTLFGIAGTALALFFDRL